MSYNLMSQKFNGIKILKEDELQNKSDEDFQLEGTVSGFDEFCLIDYDEVG